MAKRYDKSMKSRKQKQRSARTAVLHYLLSGLTLLLLVSMVIPVSTALATGIASVSLVLFGGLALLLSVYMWRAQAAARWILGAALMLALFGCVIPQAAFLRTAAQAGATLRFDPISYLTFSGDTTVTPDRLVTYKTTAKHTLRLAVYNAKRTAPKSTVMLLHGGGWRYGSYLETGEWPERLTEAGYTVISMEYRLASDSYHTWRDAPSDIEDAVAYVKDHASELGAEPRKLALMGQSAGGHLALLEAYRGKSVDTVISLYAPIDLTLDYTTSRDKSAELDFIGGPPSQYPDRYAALSPISYVSDDAPRTLLIQGKSDDLVATRNARLLASKLTSRGVEHAELYLPLTGHSFENQHGGFATQIATQRVLRFLSE